MTLRTGSEGWSFQDVCLGDGEDMVRARVSGTRSSLRPHKPRARSRSVTAGTREKKKQADPAFPVMPNEPATGPCVTKEHLRDLYRSEFPKTASAIALLKATRKSLLKKGEEEREEEGEEEENKNGTQKDRLGGKKEGREEVGVGGRERGRGAENPKPAC